MEGRGVEAEVEVEVEEPEVEVEVDGGDCDDDPMIIANILRMNRGNHVTRTVGAVIDTAEGQRGALAEGGGGVRTDTDRTAVEVEEEEVDEVETWVGSV